MEFATSEDAQILGKRILASPSLRSTLTLTLTRSLDINVSTAVLREGRAARHNAEGFPKPPPAHRGTRPVR